MKPIKLIAKIIIVIAIFFGGFYYGQKQVLAPTNSNTNIPVSANQNQNQAVKVDQDQNIKVSLMFDFGNGEIRTFNNFVVPKNATVFELLKLVTTQNNLQFTYKDYGDMGALIESINNVANNAKTNNFWHFWVNNVYSDVGASLYLLKNGDIVEWKYVPNQFNLIKH